MGVPYKETLERMRRSGALKNTSAIARVVDVTPQALSNYKKRGLMPADLVLKFAKINNISMDWLLNGEGEVSGVESECITEEQPIEALGAFKLSSEELICVSKLLKILRSSGRYDIKALQVLIDTFSSHSGEPSKESTE